MSRLLVVDDSPTIRKLVEITFRSSDVRVEFAATGTEALARAKQWLPDVVLLDFVLPDMRGLDVCGRLAADDRTRTIPIVLMSAKDESIRDLFRPYKTVVDFVPKPFAGEELAARIRTAVADQTGRPRPSLRPDSVFSLSDRELAAKALYSKLARALAFIPSWCAQMGAQSPAPFFARKIFTPEVMDSVLQALAPIFQKSEKVKGEESSEPPPGTAISGTLSGLPVGQLCRLFESACRTGALRLDEGTHGTLIYFERGTIGLVTSFEPDDHEKARGGDLEGVPAEAKAKARAEQRATAKPVHVALAEAGWVSDKAEVTRLIHLVGRQLLLRAVDAKVQTFAWQDLAVLPNYVTEHRRRGHERRNTMPFASPSEEALDSASPRSLSSLVLDTLRNRDFDEAPDLERVLDRVRGFSERLSSVQLDPMERRLLSLVDGRSTLGQLASRAGVDPSRAHMIASSLIDVRLVVDVRTMPTRPILLFETPRNGLGASLRSILSGRPEPVPIVDVEAAEDVLGAALREHPRTVILCAGDSFELHETVRRLRSRAELQDVSVVVLVELSGAAEGPGWTESGVDAVLVKPVAFADLERWIA